MLLSRAENIIRDDGDSPQNLKSIIYRLCTVPELYKGCELSISVMLSNLSCITSECGMESLISTIKDNNSIDRPLSIEQLHHEIMIRKMAPIPCTQQPPSFYWMHFTDTLEVAHQLGHSLEDPTSIKMRNLKLFPAIFVMSPHINFNYKLVLPSHSHS